MEYRLIIDDTQPESVVVTARAPSDLTRELETLVLSYGGRDHLVAYSEDEMVRLPYSKVECITVIDRKLYAVTENGERLRIKQRLFEVENDLPSYFLRINKSTIANSGRIERFKTTFSGAVDAVFQCGYTDYVSRRCLAEWKRRMKHEASRG